jgi:hypothetical protein
VFIANVQAERTKYNMKNKAVKKSRYPVNRTHTNVLKLVRRICFKYRFIQHGGPANRNLLGKACMKKIYTRYEAEMGHEDTRLNIADFLNMLQWLNEDSTVLRHLDGQWFYFSVNILTDDAGNSCRKSIKPAETDRRRVRVEAKRYVICFELHYGKYQYMVRNLAWVKARPEYKIICI